MKAVCWMGKPSVAVHEVPDPKDTESARRGENGKISHRIGINQTPELYKIWQEKQDGATKIVIDPWVSELMPDVHGKVA